MARAGGRPDISERVLGHTIVGVEGVYDRYNYSPHKAEAPEMLSGLVSRIIEPPGSNVHPISSRAPLAASGLVMVFGSKWDAKASGEPELKTMTCPARGFWRRSAVGN